MGFFADGLGLVGDAAGNIPGARGAAIRRLLYAAELYATGVEAATGQLRGHNTN
jgi:hypothetical protein